MSAATTTRVVEFLGLADLAHVAGDEASFPLAVLYPYSSDLQRVCERYDALCQASPAAASRLVGATPGTRAPLPPDQDGTATALLVSIATLHSRIAFAPGRAGASVGAAYCMASAALVPTARRRQRHRLRALLPRWFAGSTSLSPSPSSGRPPAPQGDRRP